MYRTPALLLLTYLLFASVSAKGEERVPAPSAADIEKATKQVRDLFKDEYSKLQPKVKLALAEKLFKQAEETNDDPTSRYVLYREAADLAANAGDVTLTLDALNALTSRFKGVRSEQTEPILKAITAKAPITESLILAGHLMRETDDAVEADELDLAERLAYMAAAAATRSRNVRTSSLATARIKEVEAFKKESPQVKEALKTLEKSPSDAAAALVVGKYYCFQREQWEKGLPLLAASSDAKLKAAAEKEAAGPKEATELLAAADAWYDAGSAAPAHHKRAALGRAAAFYTKAVPDLTGLNRTRAEKRLEELEKVNERNQIDEFWGAVRSAVRNKEVDELKPVGGAFGDKDYRDLAPNGGVLIGFNVGLAKFFDQDVIGTLQPIYLTPIGEKLGPVYGKGGGKPVAVKAKPGYAVGQFHIRGGGGLDGFSMTFQRIQGKGLNAADKYDSPYLGGKGGGPAPVLGDSRPIVGLYGRRAERGDERITSIGAIVAGPKPATPKK